MRVRYGRRLALDGVTFQAAPGVVSAVAGGDGAGRTTLLRCLAGVITPSEGEVRRPPATRIGYLPAGSGVYPDLSVMENLLFRAAAYGMAPETARQRSAAYLDRAGLADAVDRLGGQLSGGMRQKLGVISALLHQPDLLVLDEPTTGVDPVSRAGLWWLITRAASAGAAVVVATSYLDEAERAAMVLVLHSGRPLAAGTPAQIVAAMPGTIREMGERPAGEGGRLSWRRAGCWRVWEPPGTGQGTLAGHGAAVRVDPDLQDAVVVAALAADAAVGVADPGGGAAGAVGAAGGDRGHGAAVDVAGAGGAARTPGMAGRQRRGGGPYAGRAGQALARCEGVSRRFGRLAAVSGVDLELAPGEVVGLLGPNGAGKTTLIRMLLGLLPASAGQVRLFGEPPSRHTRRRIGYVPQGLGLYDDLTPAENLAFSAAVFGRGPAVPAAAGRGGRARTGSAAAGGLAAGAGGIALPESLRPFSRVPVRSLPLGIQRGAAFAGALAHRPDLLILDEPTSGADPLGRARLWETIAAAARAGAGVLVTTHYMDEASECDRLVVMASGRVVAEGTAGSVTGTARVTVVEAEPWAPAFTALEAAGLPVALAGPVLRVPGASPGEVRRALGDASARVSSAPATLEERFFELTLTGAAPPAPAADGRG